MREGVFALLLRFEDRVFKDRIPEGIEYEFGYEKQPPVLLGKTRLRGSIDRFDINRNDKETFYIYDYKSGRIPSSNMIKKGLTFQLPVYIRALRSGLQTKKISAALYSLNRDIIMREIPLKQSVIDHNYETKGLDISGVSLIDEYANQLREILDNGRFHHSADGMKCDYCEFRFACHWDDRRMEPLMALETDHRIYSGEKNLERWKRVDQFRKSWKGILQNMRKAFELKTGSSRRRHFDSVMRFKNELMKGRDSFPFHNEYIDELLRDIEDFEKRYLSSSPPG